MKFTVNRLLMYQAVKTVLKVVRPRGKSRKSADCLWRRMVARVFSL